jgi:hypothetical protein
MICGKIMICVSGRCGFFGIFASSKKRLLDSDGFPMISSSLVAIVCMENTTHLFARSKILPGNFETVEGVSFSWLFRSRMKG